MPIEFKEGKTFARFRFNLEGGISFDGPATEGEVEDYLISLVQRQWDFGDGRTSTQRNPSHVYSAEGAYKVRLTITTLGDGPHSIEKQRFIRTGSFPAVAYLAETEPLNAADNQVIDHLRGTARPGYRQHLDLAW